MLTYKTIKMLCKDKGVTVTGTEKELGFARGSLCKVDSSIPSMEKVQKLADYFGVTIDYLLNGKEEFEKKEIILTPKDERDIARDLDNLMSKIENGEDEPLFFNGVVLSSASIGLLRNAYKYAMEETKKENKEKYNPHKNKSR